MLTHPRTWQVIALQMATGILSAVVLAVFLHFPDAARRPEPQSGRVFLAFWLFVSVGILTLLAIGVRSSEASRARVIISTIAVWLLASYALIFLWINTYGT
jgi:hypothetical protein